jgi:hypothetical protein
MDFVPCKFNKNSAKLGKSQDGMQKIMNKFNHIASAWYYLTKGAEGEKQNKTGPK